MKRFVVAGLGIFGSSVATSLYRQGHDVIAIDRREDHVNRVAQEVSHPVVGDARQTSVLKNVGADQAEAAIISLGEDLGAGILALLAFQDIGVPQIFVKVVSFEHARVLKKIGGCEPIFPEYESALDLSVRLSGGGILKKYIRIGTGFSLQEMDVPSRWEGKTLRELQLPVKYRVSVVAVHDVHTDDFSPVPDPDRALSESDTLIITGTDEALARIADAE